MKESIDDWAERHVSLLLPLGSPLSLDQVGEVVGAQPVTQTHIERLLDLLEERGVEVSQDGAAVVDLLRQVLSTARALRAESLAPTPSAIAERAELSVRQVKVALLFADVLRR